MRGAFESDTASAARSVCGHKLVRERHAAAAIPIDPERRFTRTQADGEGGTDVGGESGAAAAAGEGSGPEEAAVAGMVVSRRPASRSQGPARVPSR